MLASDDCTCYQEPLSVWNQSAPRVYICVVLCFPCDDRLRGDAVRHIEHALERLARERPVFAGRLHSNSSGRVTLRRSPLHDIPFQVIPSEDGNEHDYEQLKEAGFPPATFVRSRFGLSGIIGSNCESIPVSKVHAEFARGGLLLSIYLHHGLVDGGSLRIFLETFAAQTRDIPIDLPSEQAFSLTPRLRRTTARIRNESNFEKLVANCPEYTILKDLSGPTQPRILNMGESMSNIERTGKIFVFRNERLQQLREQVQKINGSAHLPSAYTSLAALAFAHITKARTKVEKYLSESEPSQTAMLWNSVNWRTRAFQHATENYFGNAALPAVTRVPKAQLVAACSDEYKLAKLVPIVKSSIDAVDEDYVRRRLAMLSHAPDPRLVGVNYDPRMAEVLAFNTWRHFGADVEWSIPGVPVAKPDAIRRAHGGWNLGTALILPARTDSPTQELFVSLSVDAMELLCEDEGWMCWVDRVIG
ncbi:hypothetical protein F4809DRAFT_650757 [Biscogniauxia mediterranea]|nr:hypothetical protein F4809DRAFT_650757 [Biscogniauxia mediterranea]